MKKVSAPRSCLIRILWMIIYRVLRKKKIKIDGRVITYIEEGKGKPIVFLHGLGSDCTLWSAVIPAFAKHYKVWSFSLPWYGTHDIYGRVYTFHTYPRFLESLIKQFRIRKPVLVGHSLGGVTAVGYAAEHPRSTRAVIAVSAPFSDHKKPPPPTWEFAIHLALGRKTVREVIKWLVSQKDLVKVVSGVIFPDRRIREETSEEEAAGFFRKMPIKSIAQCFSDALKFSFRHWLEALEVPTLFVYGTKDTPVLTINGTALYSLPKKAETVSLPCEHFIPTDKPEELTMLIFGFLDQLHSKIPVR